MPGEQLQEIADLLPDLIFILRPAGELLLVNKAAAQCLGVPARDLVGQRLLELIASPVEKAATYLRRCAQMRDPLIGSVAFRGPSGETIECRCKGASIAAPPDVKIFLSCQPKQEANRQFNILSQRIDELDREVRRRHKVEQDLRELAETLELRVSERTQDLTEAILALRAESHRREQAEAALRQAQKLETLGQLTGGIAHDFNNLLTVIGGSIETLQRRMANGPIDLYRLTETASRAAQRAAMLTHRLLAFSRRQPLAPAPVDANKLVAGMSDLLRRALGESIAIETVLAGGLWRIRADPNQLENAMLNLAVNARDAMPSGGKLTIETANTHLDEAYAGAHIEVAAGQYVVVAVTDTGVGMGKDVLAKAFEPFFTTKDYGKGSGLGLSQVYGFVKQSGGHVKIYSEPEQGTTVKIYLPRLIGDTQDVEMAAPAVSPAVDARETILVVEDDEAVREYVVDLLRELGYRVLEAPDGRTGLRLLDQHPEIQLLFTDVGLPDGMNGRQLADEARRRRTDLKVLFTTGYAKNAIVHHGALDPGVDLITKPFSYAVLSAKIRSVLDK